jgi:hypothetical protein
MCVKQYPHIWGWAGSKKPTKTLSGSGSLKSSAIKTLPWSCPGTRVEDSWITGTRRTTYRVYFGEDSENIVLILYGGDKSNQDRDIANAKSYWEEYKSRAKS